MGGGRGVEKGWRKDAEEVRRDRNNIIALVQFSMSPPPSPLRASWVCLHHFTRGLVVTVRKQEVTNCA